MTYTYKNREELLWALSGGKLSGYQPTGKYNDGELKFPITVSADKDSKTFTIIEQKEETTQEVSTEKKNKTICENKFFRICVFVVAIAIVGSIIYTIVR